MSLSELLKEKLQELSKIVLSFPSKKKSIFIHWLYRHNKFLQEEETYDYSKHIVYKRGMVVEADLGFNVGSEYGGHHKVVILHNDNMRAKTVVVVPLSSLKEGQTVHKLDADLGKIEGLNENNVEGLIGQITTISKMRIQAGTIYRLTNEQLDEIDKKIAARFLGSTMRKKLND